MNTNKIVIYVTIITMIFLIGIPTVYKVIKKNHENLYLVTEKYVVESAERCLYEDVCTSNKITLSDLYSYHYIKETVIDPVSKVTYDDSSYVEITKEGSTFYSKY